MARELCVCVLAHVLQVIGFPHQRRGNQTVTNTDNLMRLCACVWVWTQWPTLGNAPTNKLFEDGFSEYMALWILNGIYWNTSNKPSLYKLLWQEQLFCLIYINKYFMWGWMLLYILWDTHFFFRFKWKPVKTSEKPEYGARLSFLGMQRNVLYLSHLCGQLN